MSPGSRSRALAALLSARRLRGQYRAGAQGRASGPGAARRLRERRRRPRIRRRGARALRDRSRLPGRRQDRRPASSMSAIACAPATWWRGSTRRTSSCRSKAPRPSSPPRPPISPRPPPTSSATRRSRARGFASIADFDRKKAANDEAEGRLERARRSLELARNQLGYAELKADADGVITATLAEAGQVVAIGQAVARLAHRGEKEAVVALPETWLGEARKSKRDGAAVVRPRPQLRCAPARALAAGRCRDPHLRGALHHRRTRTTPSRSA